MDFSIQPDLQQKMQAVEAFVYEHIVPLESLLLTQQYDALHSALDKLRDQVKANGWWAPHLPASLGGTSTGLLDLGLLSEVIGQTPLGHYVFGCQAPDAGNAELLHLYANKEQEAEFLKPLALGHTRSCFGMTEPDSAGSNPTLLETEARLENGEWVINGKKWFTTAADGASFCIVMAVTDPDQAKHQRASMLIVPTDTPGYNLLRNIPVMGHAGGGYFSHAEIEFKDCRIPQANILGERGQGFMMAQQRLGPGRIQHCMRWIGVARRALKEMTEYAKLRKLNSRETLADQQTTQQRLADGTAELYAARALILETAWMVENQSFSAARDRISMIKFHTANMLQHVVDMAIQVHGALGMTDDKILAFYYREERAARIYDGPDEVHRMSLARRLLK